MQKSSSQFQIRRSTLIGLGIALGALFLSVGLLVSRTDAQVTQTKEKTVAASSHSAVKKEQPQTAPLLDTVDTLSPTLEQYFKQLERGTSEESPYVSPPEQQELRSSLEESKKAQEKLSQQLSKAQTLLEQEKKQRESLEQEIAELHNPEDYVAQERERREKCVTRLKKTLEQEEKTQQELLKTQQQSSQQGTLLSSINDQNKKLTQDLQKYRGLYQEERQQRLSREELFGRLSESVQKQKEWADQIERSRDQLATGLVRMKKQYAELAKGQKTAEPSPAPSSVSDGTQIHQVTPGDTLSRISAHYYGTTSRWQDIYEANRQAIPDKDKIIVGTTLVIP